MRPKKRDRLAVEEPKSQFDEIQADHELFIQAFEKPTQIYRYLRTRNLVSPVFLHRTLKYMKGRSQRDNELRKDFKVDSILSNTEKTRVKKTQSSTEPMHLHFVGFFDEEKSEIVSSVVEVFLVKLTHTKRKEGTCPLYETNVGKTELPYNPSGQSHPKSHSITIPTSMFNHNNGYAVRSYMLQFRVTQKVRVQVANTSAPSIVKSELSTEEPVSKRRRSTRATESAPVDGQVSTSTEEVTVVYGAELVVYDRHQRRLLTDGEYELVLQCVGSKSGINGTSSWETIMDGKAVGPFEMFNQCPTLKFSLSWAQPNETSTRSSRLSVITNGDTISPALDDSDMENGSRLRDGTSLSPRKKRIFYQFLYKDNTRQQTEARDDMHCPWCLLNCIRLYSLLKHLRLCHARFNFVYSDHPKGARIDVSISKHFDGSYSGNPQDIHSFLGYAFSRRGPVRRTPVTQVLAYQKEHVEFDLNEFLDIENDALSPRRLMQGHNRLYFNSVTVQPVRTKDIDQDSEADIDPVWLREKTVNLIDDFTDVNEGEKEIMKMWNLHCMHHNYIGDCSIMIACHKFVEEYGERIINQNLTRNFILHLTNLYDFGILRHDMVKKTISQLLRLQYQIMHQSPPKLESQQNVVPVERPRDRPVLSICPSF